MRSRSLDHLWRPWLAVGSVLAIAAAAWLVWPRLARWTAERRAAEALGQLRSCLGDDTDALMRRRAIAAAISDDDWPARCAPRAAALEAALGAAGRPLLRCEGRCCPGDARCEDLSRALHLATRLHDQIARGRFTDGIAASLLAQAESAGIRPLEASGPAPPAPIETPSIGPPIVVGELARSALTRTVDGRWWLMMHERGKRASLCEISLEAATARCRAVPESIPVDGDLYLIDGGLSGSPHLLAEHRARQRWIVHDAEGATSLDAPGRTVGATSLERGAAALVATDDGYELVRGDAAPVALEGGSPPLLYAGYALQHRDGALLAYSLIDSVPVQRVGTIDRAAAVKMRACASNGLAAVRVRGATGTPDSLALRTDGPWDLVPAPRGAPDFGLSCHGVAAHLSWIETVTQARLEDGEDAVKGGYRIHDAACTKSGCSERTAAIELVRHSPTSRFFVASLGDEIAVIWRSEQGDIRARIARPEELLSAATISLFDDVDHEGVPWDSAPLELLAAERHALVLVEGTEGVLAFLLGVDGLRRVQSQ